MLMATSATAMDDSLMQAIMAPSLIRRRSAPHISKEHQAGRGIPSIITGRGTAIDGDRRALDVAALRAAQEHRKLRDIRRLGHPLDAVAGDRFSADLANRLACGGRALR